MNEKCLLITTKDQRKFLTYEKNLLSLVEFAKTFGAEIYLVVSEKGQKVFELKDLTAALCDQNYNMEPKCEKLKRIYPKTKRSRKTILTEAAKIRNFIRSRFLAGKPVSLKELKKKYKKHNLTDACLCNHLAMARKALSREGYSFKKIGAGKYCLSK
jgi:Holliday junction resolvase